MQFSTSIRSLGNLTPSEKFNVWNYGSELFPRFSDRNFLHLQNMLFLNFQTFFADISGRFRSSLFITWAQTKATLVPVLFFLLHLPEKTVLKMIHQHPGGRKQDEYQKLLRDEYLKAQGRLREGGKIEQDGIFDLKRGGRRRRRSKVECGRKKFHLSGKWPDAPRSHSIWRGLKKLHEDFRDEHASKLRKSDGNC